MINFILGVIVSVVGAIVYNSRSFSVVGDWVSKRLSRSRRVKEFEAALLADDPPYVSFPDKGRRAYYIRRHPKPPKIKRMPSTQEDSAATPHVDETPTYHFFIRKDVVLNKFLGFLIPPLDAGHGREQRLTFSKAWDTYLADINERASTATDRRRIVFFDKTLLVLFLFDTKRIFDDAQLNGADFKALSTIPPATESARRVVQYAYDVAKIHTRIQGVIDCRYIAKSSVSASAYYDFGLYHTENVDIVYTPIPFKDDQRSIAEERVFIGNTARQKLGIAEFRSDFEQLWAEADADEHFRHQKNGSKSQIIADRLLNPADKYYAYDYCEPWFFDAVYVEQIAAIITDKMDRNVRDEGL